MKLLQILTVAALALLPAAPSLATDRAIIVLDGSGSMWAQIDGEARISIARETLSEVLSGLPETLELGLMTYGHRTKGDCSDIEMLVPAAAGTGPAIIEAAEGINPKGKTPISEAVKMAAEALNYTEDKATVILITDGLETCEADPCALASDLEQSGIDFTTHVVGFGLTEEEGKQVACLAENTGGKYFPASDASGLADALTTTVAAVSEPAPEPASEPEPVAEFNFTPDVVLAEGGESLPKDFGNVWEIYKLSADGGEGEWVQTDYGGQYKTNLAPGKYLVRAKIDYAETEQVIEIKDGEVADPLFVLNAGLALFHPYASEGAEIDAGAAIVIDLPRDVDPTFYGDTKTYVPAGSHSVKAILGEGEITQDFTVAAGETVELDLIVGVGHAVINADYIDGMPVEEGGLAVKILEARKNIQGERKEVAYAYGPASKFDLPPGDYVALTELEGASVETPFTITAGETTDVLGVLNAGVLVISAPGAARIEIFEIRKDIQGNRKQLAYNFGETFQITMPEGDYAIVAFAADDTQTEVSASVTGGERTEVTVQ